MNDKRKQGQNHSVDLLFTVVMFLVYAVSLLTFVYLGANVYQSVTSRMNHTDVLRTAQAYLTEKVRQHDSRGAVYLSQVEDCQALAIEEMVENREYVTYIYADEGMLKELWIPKDREPKKKEGSEILPLGQLAIEDLGDGLLRFSFPDDENHHRTVTIKRKSEA